MIRLIASDMDDTLLGPDRALPPDAIDTILTARRAGIRFAACSGRQYDNLRRLFIPLGDSIDYVCENGTTTLSGGEIIDYHLIPREDAYAMIEDILALRMDLLVSGKHATYILDTSRSFCDYILFGLRNTCAVISDLRALPDVIVKVSGYIESGLTEDAAARLSARWGDRYTATPAGPQWFDITASSKGIGLKSLCRHLNIPLADVAAFGDSFNDVSMLDIVGHPYLIDHADPRLRGKGYRLFHNVPEEMRRIAAGNEG